MRLRETIGDSWDSAEVMEIMRLMRIILMGIPESQVYYSGIMRILIQIKTKKTHETQGECRGLMILIETTVDS